MAIASYVGAELVANTDKFDTWLTRTNSIITDMGSVVVTEGNNNPFDVDIGGEFTVANTIFISASNTETRSIEVGFGRVGDGVSRVDLIGDGTYTSYGLSLHRGGTGTNADSSILHRGAGSIILNAEDAGGDVKVTINTSDVFIANSTGVDVTGTLTNTSKIVYDPAVTGASSFDGTADGIEIITAGMDATSKYTPPLKFGSDDPDFVENTPKYLAAIVGKAGEAYSANTDGGMALTFWTTPDNPGANNAMVERGEFAPEGTFIANYGIHANTASSGATAVTGSDEGVFENSGNAGISILTPDVDVSSLVFGSPTVDNGGIINWSANTGIMNIATNLAGAELVLSSGAIGEALRLDSTQNSTFANSVTVSANGIDVRNDGTDSTIAIFRSNLGTNDRNIRIESPLTDSVDDPFRFLTFNSISFEIDGTERFLIDSVGNSTFDGQVSVINGNNLHLKADDTQNSKLKVGEGRTTGTGNAIVDFVNDTVYTDYAFRIARFSGGNTSLRHRGTGDFKLIAEDAGSYIALRAGDTDRVVVDETDTTITGPLNMNGNMDMGGSSDIWNMDKIGWDSGTGGDYIHWSTTNGFRGFENGTRKFQFGGTYYMDDLYDNTTSNGANVRVLSGGQLKRSTSSGAFKINRTSVDPSIVDLLNPVSFESTHEGDWGRRFTGFIAEEVEEVFPEASVDDGENYDVRAIVSVLVAKVQEQTATINDLITRIQALESA